MIIGGNMEMEIKSPSYNFAFTLDALVNKCLKEKKKFQIGRALNRHDSKLDLFWLSTTRNTKTRLFSVEDLSSYWLIYDEETE